jgi:N-acetylglutamate synthase-like GNAT family acetyltransferase
MEHDIVYKKLETNEEITKTKDLIMEYIKWINQDLSFQDIDDELENFPNKYEEPLGAFIIAKENENVIGCVGLRNLDNKICEIKRLFVNDDYKGRGIGKKLVKKIIRVAKIKNYERIRLDTINTMEVALKIYYKNGFYEIEPYYNNPYDNIVYLEKIL